MDFVEALQIAQRELGIAMSQPNTKETQEELEAAREVIRRFVVVLQALPPSTRKSNGQ